MMGVRRRPQPVRNLSAASLVASIVLGWIGPINLSGIIGYNVYQGTETTRVQNVIAQQFPSSPNQGSNKNFLPPSYQVTIPGLVAGTSVPFWVSAYTSLLESVKTQIIAAAS